jgi:hypothetical protein
MIESDSAQPQSPKRRAREKAIRGTDRDTQLAQWGRHSYRVGEILRTARQAFRGKLLTQIDVVVELEETFGVPVSPAWLSLLEGGKSNVPPSPAETLALGICLELLDLPEFQELESSLHYALLPTDVEERGQVLQMFERIRDLPSDGLDRPEMMRDLYDLLLA